MFSVEMIQTLAFSTTITHWPKGEGVHPLLVTIFDHRRAPIQLTTFLQSV